MCGLWLGKLQICSSQPPLRKRIGYFSIRQLFLTPWQTTQDFRLTKPSWQAGTALSWGLPKWTSLLLRCDNLAPVSNSCVGCWGTLASRHRIVYCLVSFFQKQFSWVWNKGARHSPWVSSFCHIRVGKELPPYFSCLYNMKVWITLQSLE